jgi:hypothetical protein
VAEDTGSLLDLARSKLKRRGPDCGVAIAIQNHPDRAADIEELIDATPTTIQYSVAAETLNEVGIPLKADTISRHKRKRCSCVAAG